MTAPLWTCPACGRPFANRNQTHTCRPLRTLDALFEGCEPRVRQTFEAVLDAECLGWLAEAYQVGCQEHLSR